MNLDTIRKTLFWVVGMFFLHRQLCSHLHQLRLHSTTARGDGQLITSDENCDYNRGSAVRYGDRYSCFQRSQRLNQCIPWIVESYGADDLESFRVKGNLIAVTYLALSEEVISDAEVNGEMIYVCEALVEQSHPVNKKVNFFQTIPLKNYLRMAKQRKNSSSTISKIKHRTPLQHLLIFQRSSSKT